MVDTPAIWKGITQVNTTDAAATGGTNQQYNPQIAALKNGGYVVVWTDESRAYNPSGTAILGQRYDALGQKVGGEVELSRANTGSYGQPAVTTLSNGDIAVAFDDQLMGAGFGDVYVRVFDSSLTFLGEDFIAGIQTTIASITALAGGGYAVSYTVIGGFDTEVRGQIRGASGAQVGNTFEWDDSASDAGSGDDQHESELATLSNGNVVAVWQDEFFGDAQDNDIRFAIRSPSGTLVDAGRVDPSSSNDVKPDVAALKGGGFVVAWTSDTDVVARLRDNEGNAFGSLITTTSTAGNQHAPSVTELADGGFLLTWSDAVFPRTIRGQRFTALGVKVGEEFTLNDSATVRSLLNNEESAVALLSDGRVAFATNSIASTGDYDVITSIWDPRTGPVNGTAGSEILTSTPEGATVNGLGGNDALFGRQGNDTLNGGLGADTMRGGAGNDTMAGEDGADTMNGEAGNDVINGGLGNDVLSGAAGADRFLFTTAIKPKDSNVDTIADFVAADDTILLDNGIFTKLKTEGVLKAKFFEVGKKAKSVKDAVIYNDKTGDILYDKNGDKKGGALIFAKLEGNPDDVSAADFLVI